MSHTRSSAVTRATEPRSEVAQRRLPRWLRTALVLAATLAGAAVLGGASGVVVDRIGDFDPTWRLAPVICAALVGAVVIVARPSLGAVGAVVAIVWIGVVRRIAGGASAYVENDPLIAAPALLMVPAVISRLRARRRSPRTVWLMVLLVLMMLGATAYGLTRAPTLAVGRTAVFEVLPILLAIGLVWTGDRDLPRLILATLKWVIPSAAIYGLVQYFAPPSWDLAWLVARATQTTTFGYPYAGQFRLFGPTSSPLAFATLLAVGIILFSFSKVSLPIRIVIIALMVVPLLLTAVRTAVFALVLALALALVRYRGFGALVPILFGFAFTTVALTAIVSFDPEIANRFLVSDLGNDESFLARSALLAENFTASVLSLGIGFGTVLNGAQTVDNGYLAAFIELGFLGGLLYAVLPIVVLLRSGGRGSDPASAGSWTVILFLILSQVSAPLLQGEFGFVLWPLIALHLLEDAVPERRSHEAMPALGRDPLPTRKPF